eukprot:jgi/Ulvmu1/7687/UM038_0119.1
MAGCIALYTWYDATTVVTFIATLLITYLSQTGVFGDTNSEISNQRPTPITPEGWTFSIWGIIFSGQAAALIYLLIRRRSSDVEFKRSAVKSLWLWLCIGWAAEAAWTVVFALNTRAALSVCAGLLITSFGAFCAALYAVLPLRPGAFDCGGSAIMRHLLAASIAINAAWLSVATVLGLLIATAANHPGNDLQAAAITLVVIAAVAGAAIAVSGACVSYSLTLAWAFAGVATKDGASDSVRLVAWICVGVMLAVSAAAGVLRALRSPRDRNAKDPALATATELQYSA